MARLTAPEQQEIVHQLRALDRAQILGLCGRWVSVRFAANLLGLSKRRMNEYVLNRRMRVVGVGNQAVVRLTDVLNLKEQRRPRGRPKRRGRGRPRKWEVQPKGSES